MATVLIYGASGYTGRIASQYAAQTGLKFIVAGRTESNIKDLAASLNAPYQIFDVNDSDKLDPALASVRVLLNCAGPFKYTAKPLIEACIRNGTHYLDTAAELDSYLLAEKLDEDAQAAGVLLLPGCGGSAAMLGCLSGYAVKRARDPIRIDLALHVAGSFSRGSAISAAENLTPACLQRLDGELATQNANNTHEFDFDDGHGKVICSPITFPDLITIWKSTRIRNIGTFVHLSEAEFPTGDLAQLPDGPTPEQRASTPYHAAVAVTSKDGSVVHAVLHTVNGYTFTSLASVEAARKVAAGIVQVGFQTSAGLFGSDFVHTIPGSVVKDL